MATGLPIGVCALGLYALPETIFQPHPISIQRRLAEIANGGHQISVSLHGGTKIACSVRVHCPKNDRVSTGIVDLTSSYRDSGMFTEHYNARKKEAADMALPFSGS